MRSVAMWWLTAKGNGEPLSGVNAPLFVSTLKPEMLEFVASGFAAKRNLPVATSARLSGLAPAGNGDPATGVRMPVVASTENAEMLLEPPLFAT